VSEVNKWKTFIPFFPFFTSLFHMKSFTFSKKCPLLCKTVSICKHFLLPFPSEGSPDPTLFREKKSPKIKTKKSQTHVF